MDIKQARIYVSLIESGKFNQAAAKSKLTKSAISHMISALEQEFGVTLLSRNPHSVVLTEYGKAVYDNAKKIIHNYESALDAISGLKGEINGELKVGIGSMLEPYIRKAGLRMIEEHPNLDLKVYVYRASTLNELLRAHKIDIAFTLRKSYDNEGIDSIPVVPVRLCAIINKTHRLAQKDIISYDEIKASCLALPDEDERSLDTISKQAGIDISDLHPRLSINNADGMLNAIEENSRILGIGTPLHIINRPNLIAKTIDCLNFDIQGYAHVMKDAYQKNSARELCRQIKEYALPYYNIVNQYHV